MQTEKLLIIRKGREMKIEIAMQKSAETKYANNYVFSDFKDFYDKALSVKRVSAEKNGSAFISSKLRNSIRTIENVVHTSLIVFDVDQTPEDDILHLEEVEDALIDLGLEHAVYTSYSNVPETPRFRIVLPLSRPVYEEEFLSVAAATLETLDEMLDEKLSKVIDRCWKEPSRCYYLFTVHPDRQNGSVSFYNPGNPVNADEMKMRQSVYGLDLISSAAQMGRTKSSTTGGANGRSYDLMRTFSAMYGSHSIEEITRRIKEQDETDNAGAEYFRDYTYTRHRPRAGESADQAAWRACEEYVRSHINWLKRKQNRLADAVAVSKRAESRDPMPAHDALIKIRSIKEGKTKKGGETSLLELQVMSGEHAGRHFWHRLYGSGNHATSIKISKDLVSKIATSTETQIEDLKDLIKAEGKIMKARIKLNKGTNGFPDQNEIGSIYI